MSDTSPFDHRPDAELGRHLRDALAAPDEGAFVRRVMASADRAYGETLPGQWLGVLTSWARPGLVAAMLVVAALAFWAGLEVGRSEPVAGFATLADPLSDDSSRADVPALLAEREAPNVDIILAAAMRD
jgi:hypothetical protein